ncbi:EAL domain-containing protein [Rhodoferax sp.]|uniref:EAL domain-containing protein n=1 Tax=Rhodoferax sp. TaxID=50421 RepID=UPI00374DE6F3
MSRILGHYPRVVGIVCGYALALAIAVAVCVVTLQLRLQDIESGHAQVIGNMKAVQADVGRLLGELNQSHTPICSTENLNRLRSLLFSHRYARDIGLVDAQGRLFCTTDIGLLPTPYTHGPGAIDGSIGRYYRKMPLPLAHGTVSVTMVERGPFQVAMEPNGTVDAFTRYADTVWAGRPSQRTQIFKGKRAALTDALVTPETAHLRLDWAQGIAVVTTTEPGVSPVSVQSVVPLQELYLDHRALLAAAVALCLLLGFLTSDVVTRRCRHFQSMDHRIRYLCHPDNVVCHYQPILELATGRTIGCEVLARLRDGTALVYPDQFIPALMRQNLAWTFDAAVSSCALRELGAALPPQDDFKVALNFFPQNLQRDAVHAHLRTHLQAMARNDLQIELEVTEYNFSPEIVPELQRLKADGYYISIDDFGTGYSNLGMVKRVAPDFLKIDKSFVYEMEDASLRSSLIPEIIGIAKAVNSQVVAEGIENAAQAAQLRALGVQYGQGYYFAKPMPLAAFLQYLNQSRAAG